jgi:type 2 lantibiotic biosynthesis protein LanM
MTIPSESDLATSFFAAAREIAVRLRETSVKGKGGSVTWLNPAAGAAGPVPLGPHLYDGTAGIALFLAAMEAVQGDGEWGEMSRQAILPLRRRLAELAASPERAGGVRLGVGGLSGLGAFVYAFVTLGQLLDEPALIDEAHGLLPLFALERIAGDEHLDVVLGSGGAILALLALDRARPEPGSDGRTAVEVASECASHLLARRVSVQGGPRAWPPGPGLAPLAGFAHGAAGICLALLRLYKRTGQADLWAAAQEGLVFERGLYSPEERNWRDMRVPEIRFLDMWCHGAPGIALGRLAALDVADDPAIRVEIAAALARTRAVPLSSEDHLCCGNLGRAEILSSAGQILGDPDLLSASRALAWQVLERGREQGGFGLPDGSLDAPSLFKGIAGIGYSFLRLATRSPNNSILILC